MWRWGDSTRSHRIRWDKPAEEADTLDTLAGMIVE